jgi:hypothetical protein
MARSVVRAIVSLGCVSGLTVGGQAVTQKAIARIPTHAIRGAVKAISAFYVVIVTGSGKKAREMTFVLGPSTERNGDLTIGATVSVRYRIEGKALLATAVAAHGQKPRASGTPPPAIR